MESFAKITLFTGNDGRAKFREDAVGLDEGSPATRLSAMLPAGGMQLRTSPVGFRSQPHVTEAPQWVFILDGIMEIGLPDGTIRQFRKGEHFFSADVLPEDAEFDPEVHGHWSGQVGDLPLLTLFVKT